MRRMLVVAVREYQAAVKTKAFIISLVLMPVMMGGSIVAQVFLKDRVDIADKRVAVVDETGLLYDAIETAARLRNETKIFSGEGDARKQVKPRFVVEKVELVDGDPAQTAFALSERVRAKGDEKLFAFVMIGPDAIRPGADPVRAGAHYHSQTPTYEEVADWAEAKLNERIQELRFEGASVDLATVRAAVAPVPLANLELVTRDEQGNIKKAEQSNRAANFLIPLGLMMLMFMVIMVGATPLMQSVLEEKMQRIAEVLLGSISPFQLMMGKLLGVVGVSLTMATFYLVGGYLALRNAGYAQFFPAHLIWWFVVFQGLAVLMFGSLFIAVGAAVTDMRESQSLMTPIMLIVCAPMFVWVNVLREPTAAFSTAISLFPPCTPMLMIVRQAVPPGIPLWQPLLGVVLVLFTTVAFVWAAGRIFRVGLLMQGRGANLREMCRWVLRG